MSIQAIVDVHFQELLRKVRNKKYRLHNDEDPLFRMLIEHELRERKMPITYEQGNEYMTLAKSIAQYSGQFWQELFGNSPGWEDLGIGHPTKCDLINRSRNIIMELKNKHNTMNSDSMTKVVEKLEKANNNHRYNAVLGIVHDTTERGNHGVVRLGSSVQRVTGECLFELVYEDPDARSLVMERIAAMCDDAEMLSKYMVRRIMRSIVRKNRFAEEENDLAEMLGRAKIT